MYTFLCIILLLLPIFNTEPIQAGFESDDDDDDDLLMQRSVAASYLFGLPTRRYHHRLLDSLSGLSNNDDPSQQRTKRIYWENLAFHATDYNQKPKKI